jgi:hypothetical protein
MTIMTLADALAADDKVARSAGLRHPACWPGRKATAQARAVRLRSRCGSGPVHEAAELIVEKQKPYRRKAAAIIIATALVSFPAMIITFRALT